MDVIQTLRPAAGPQRRRARPRSARGLAGGGGAECGSGEVVHVTNSRTQVLVYEVWVQVLLLSARTGDISRVH